MVLRSWLLVLGFLAPLVVAGPHGNPPVALRDIKPGFAKGGRVLRSRTPKKPGLFVKGKRHRGLNSPVPGRFGVDVDATFQKFTVEVAALDGSRGAVAFKVVGDGRVLAATPPLFAGSSPVKLEVDVSNVLLLEFIAEGERARAAWIGGRLWPADGKDTAGFRALDQPFSPAAYPTKFRRRVNRGIKRAVGYLLTQQRKTGLWNSRSNAMGVTALATLALLKAGVKPDEAAMTNAFRWLRGQRYTHVYSVACLLMAIEARYFPAGHDEKNAYLDRPKKAKFLIPAEEQAWIASAAAWLTSMQGAGFPPEQRKFSPVWRYPHGGYDLSNTQYALLGLSAANRCGVATSRVWLPALKFLLGAQEKDGPRVLVSRYITRGKFLRRRYERAKARGFGYQINTQATGSMTSAGLCSLILCHQALYRSGRNTVSDRTRVGIRDALAWLEEYYEIDENPFVGRNWWHYYLFNLERAGVLLDQRYIGTRDWYREGCDALLAKQGADGGVGGVINTAFALLFWKRATVPAITSPLR
ncbi:MAG: NPCBM/NEW2 domain-containing protein [Planctomycetota bacterium]